MFSIHFHSNEWQYTIDDCFLSLDLAVKYAASHHYFTDYETHIVSEETGEILFIFNNGILVDMSPAVHYLP
jgi:hypothetical protein